MTKKGLYKKHSIDHPQTILQGFFHFLRVDLGNRRSKQEYIITSTSIHIKDKSLFSDCKDFISPLDGIWAGMSKKVNKVDTKKRYHGYGKEKLLGDCEVILDVALMDFLAVMGKLQGPEAISGEALDKNDRLLVLYYLERRS